MKEKIDVGDVIVQLVTVGAGYTYYFYVFIITDVKEKYVYYKYIYNSKKKDDQAVLFSHIFSAEKVLVLEQINKKEKYFLLE